MGLGPHGTSLAERVALPPPVWSNPFAMQMEGIARAEARRERAIYLSQKNRVPRKAEAPVEPAGYQAVTDTTKKAGYRKMQGWVWVGETIESKGMRHGTIYLAAAIRKAGFKLPRIGGKKK